MILGILFAVLALVVTALVFMLNGLYSIARIRIPYVPTPAWAIAWLQAHYAIPAGSVVYDLGCGDARVLSELAKKYPAAQFVGIEVQWWPYVLAKWRARNIPNLKIGRVDFWKRPISDGTIVFCYLFQPILERMRSKFEAELRTGSAVISFGFRIPGWVTRQEIADPSGRTQSRILFYQR